MAAPFKAAEQGGRGALRPPRSRYTAARARWQRAAVIWEGRLASATITAGRAAPVSCSPEDLPGGVPSGGRNSMARARAPRRPCPFWSVSLSGIRRSARKCGCSGEIRRLVGFHACFANRGLAWTCLAQICASRYAYIGICSWFLLEGFVEGGKSFWRNPALVGCHAGFANQGLAWTSLAQICASRQAPGGPGRPRIVT